MTDEPPQQLPGAEALTIGPASRLFPAESDAEGLLEYQVENRTPRRLHFGPAQAATRWMVLDQILTAACFGQRNCRLLALAAFGEARPRVLLLGREWGRFLDGEGKRHQVADPLEEMRRMRLPLCFGERPEWIGLRLCLNVHYREIFSRECRRLLQPGSTNMLEIYFNTPSGDFAEARLTIQDSSSQRLMKSHGLDNFPLDWRPLLGGRAQARPARAAVPSPRPRPPADTRELDDGPCIEALEAIDDPRRLWRELERNLELGRPARSYRLLQRFGDSVGEHAGRWPEERLKKLLGPQPGSMLAPLMFAWPLDKALAVAEDNPEREYLMEWLREREVERLMGMDPTRPVGNRTEALRWLGLSEDSRPDPRALRRVWRRLLGFLNSDYGRSAERAIHRKKDEVAKRLQQARDLLDDG